MSRTYLPNSKQFQRINKHLSAIANSLGAEIDLSTWEGVQKIVTKGLAPDYFPVGSQFVVNHNAYGDMVFDVVAHDYLKSTRNRDTRTMTIMSHDTIPGVMLADQPEAFYMSDWLPKGTYNFTLASNYYDWVKGTYYFTLGDDLEYVEDYPLQLSVLRLGDEGLTSAKITGHYLGNSDELFRVDIHSGSEGESLGTLGVELNHPQRVYWGNNNYAESATRQFLNSSAGAGKVWSHAHDYDRPPTWVNSLPGFVNGLDSDFLSIVGEVSLPCSRNSTYENPGFNATTTYSLTTDKFYLPSQMEIVGNSDGINSDGSALFPYYDGAIATDRIKYQMGSQTPMRWLTRSPYRYSAAHVRCINAQGLIGETTESSPIAVACTIVGRI
jgi:hypothetical protein